MVFTSLFTFVVTVILGESLSLPPPTKCQRRQVGPPVVDDKPSTTLTNLPTEIILHINSCLPPQSKICLGLTWKSFWAALNKEVELKIPVPEEKSLLLRLLERDLPSRMLCFHCNKLYCWKIFRGGVSDYRCPLRGHGIEPRYSLATCTSLRHLHPLRREMVDAFLRGFEFGPAYGPQLSELAHECEPRCFWNDHVASKFEARVVQGKLILHATYRKSIRLPLYDPATQDPDNSNISLSAAIPRSTYIDIDNFNRLGCVHCMWTLPAVIMHTIKYLDC